MRSSLGSSVLPTGFRSSSRSRLLPAAAGLDAGLVAVALEHGVGAQLLAVDADVFRFRHMLTREAVAAELLPPRRVTLAARALAALEAAHPGLPGEAGDLAANLALQAGDQDQAGGLLFASGRSALDRAHSPPPSIRCAAPWSCSVTVSSVPKRNCSLSRAWR